MVNQIESRKKALIFLTLTFTFILFIAFYFVTNDNWEVKEIRVPPLSFYMMLYVVLSISHLLGHLINLLFIENLLKLDKNKLHIL